MKIIDDLSLPVTEIFMVKAADIENLLVEVYDAENPTISLGGNLVEFVVTGHGNATDAEETIKNNDMWLTIQDLQILLDDMADMGYVKTGTYVVKQ
jgi:hypothetical protein